MSLSRERLKQFLLEDAIANKCNRSFMGLLLSFIRYRPEKILVYRYLWHLRHTEYYQSQKSIFGKIMHIYHKRKCSRLGSRYMIFIPPNKSGFGLRINHLSGGADAI